MLILHPEDMENSIADCMATINIITTNQGLKGTKSTCSQSNIIMLPHMDKHKPKVGKLSKELT